jgi:predicted small secreted protein
MIFGAAVLSLAALAGCNTIRGIGEDISALGRALSDSTGTGNSEVQH